MLRQEILRGFAMRKVLALALLALALAGGVAAVSINARPALACQGSGC